MQWFRHARRSATTVIAGCVAVAVVAAVSYAATGEFAGSARSAAGGRLYACVTARFQTLNLSSAGAACPSGQRKVSLEYQGSAWAAGPGGAPRAERHPRAAGTEGRHGRNRTEREHGRCRTQRERGRYRTGRAGRADRTARGDRTGWPVRPGRAARAEPAPTAALRNESGSRERPFRTWLRRP